MYFFQFLLCASLWILPRFTIPVATAVSSMVYPGDFPEMISRAPLYTTPNGYSYYMHLETLMNPPVSSLLSSSVESSPFKILLDTGTAFYVLRQPLNTTTFNQLTQSISLSDTECLYLLIDTTNANFTGTPEYPRNCVQSVGNSAANVSLDVMSSGRLMHVFHYL